jgi:segregation and condensation protein A
MLPSNTYTIPEDLYIPVEALRVFLETFEGPLDLLLYLIKKNNLNILDIPVASITEQYVQYVEMMKEFKLELAAEYLVMAVMLAEIKSRMLLPKPVLEPEENDPRVELILKLQEYERYKMAAVNLDNLPQENRDIFVITGRNLITKGAKPLPNIELADIYQALREVLTKATVFTSHHIIKEALSVRERMTCVLNKLQTNEFVAFADLFDISEGRAGVVVTFIAVLELLREAVINIVQTKSFGQIHVQIN